MRISDLMKLIHAEAQSEGEADQDISSGYTCDLLSWVMAHGQKDMAWVTVQTNINVIAVAALHDIGCVILPESVKMGGAALDKAQDEKSWVLSSPKSAYEICGLLYSKGIA